MFIVAFSRGGRSTFIMASKRDPNDSADGYKDDKRPKVSSSDVITQLLQESGDPAAAGPEGAPQSAGLQQAEPAKMLSWQVK